MPRLIFKCPYIKSGTSAATAHLENYVKYMATRSGVERIDPGCSEWPATLKQKKMVEQILQDFPLSRGMFEYEDYEAAPTRANASEFITRALEDNYDQIAKKDNYLKYIATRPRAQRVGSHGLFTGEEDQLVLTQVAEAVAAHPGNVWLPIISLRREDAARLGYDKAEEWKALLTQYAMEMAAAMKIPWEDFRWYAAFHDAAHHPHVHMVCYSADPPKGFLTTQGITQIKSGLAKQIFRQELTELYQKQTQSRDALNEDARSVMEQLIEQMQSGTADGSRMEELMEHLAERLRHTGGRKQYGYLKAPLKAVVNEIVDELAKDPRVAAAYALWYELREDVLRTYKDDLPQRLPLSQQKEFKRIKNIVIEEAVKMCIRDRGILRQTPCLRKRHAAMRSARAIRLSPSTSSTHRCWMTAILRNGKLGFGWGIECWKSATNCGAAATGSVPAWPVRLRRPKNSVSPFDRLESRKSSRRLCPLRWSERMLQSRAWIWCNAHAGQSIRWDWRFPPRSGPQRH